jgi:hypothetical protein
MSVSASAMLYEDGTETRSMTRRTSWTAPTGYYLYEALYDEAYENMPTLSKSNIDLFMTHDVAKNFTTPNPLEARLRYSPSATTTNLWKLVLPNNVEEDSVKQGSYYAYGFIPRDAADNAELTKLPTDGEHPTRTWSEGAELTIKGLKSVAVDPCIIIGAKHGFSPDYDGDYTDENGNSQYDDGTDTRTNRLRAGDFSFYLQRGTTTVEGQQVPKPNYLYFLFDHLYSALSISMRVNGDYHAIRHIKLKALYLRTKNTSGPTSEKTDVTITLRSNIEGTNPISDITYTPSADQTKSDSTVYKNSAGFPLTTNYSSFLGHFMPQGVTTLILTSVYDVYDTHGNLIRKDCKATNTMSINELFPGQEGVSRRGWQYHVNLTINPTYLYVLSEPDLNDPTIEIDN